MKNALEKPGFDLKRMGDMFEEMNASLGDCDTAGHGTFRKKFIKVWGGFSLNPPYGEGSKLWCCVHQDQNMLSYI